MARLLILALTLFAALAQAQTYRWVDKEGKVHYGDKPPLPSEVKEVQERKIFAPTASESVPYAVREAMRDFPVTLYVSSDCGEACANGRDYLRKRKIPFTEKPAATDEEIAALKQLLKSDSVSLPVLMVGSRVARGYLESAWGSLLDAAGYPKSP